MIVDRRERRIISTLGWVDGPALVLWDTESNEMQVVGVAESEAVELVEGREDRFAVWHPLETGFRVSVRHMSAPTNALAQATVKMGQARLEGDSGEWAFVPSVYAGPDTDGPGADQAPCALLVIAPDGTAGEVQPLAWFNRDAYDPMYHSILTPVQVPGERLVLIPVQRSSRLVIHDLVTKQEVGHIELADRGGNPTLRFRTNGELWVDDYDTLLRIDRDGWVKRDARLLQASVDDARAFVGDWSFTQDGTVCAVARPFSGDVVGLDTTTFKVTSRAVTGEQPLGLAVLNDGRVFARDWKTGKRLSGQLQPLD